MGITFDLDNNLTSDNPFYGEIPTQSVGQRLREKYAFSYQECKDLYSYWSLGKRIVESIVDFSLSVERDIVIKDAPEEVATRFKEIETKQNITQLVKNFLILTRVYGAASLFVASKKPEDDFKNLSPDDYKFDFTFKALDPLNFKCSISQDPLSYDFLEAKYISINGRLVGKNRNFVLFNGNPMFIQFNKSNLNFGGRSVFANMGRLIETWDTLFTALEAIAVKAGAVIIENSQSSMSDPTAFEVAQQSARLFQQMKIGNVAALNAGQTANFFNLNGATEIGAMIKEVKEALAMTLNDTPTAILLDEDLSNGLSNGSEDMRNVIIKVNSFRELYLKPVYEFIDKHLFFKAWDDDFINSMRSKADYSGLSNYEIRLKWMNEFDYKWGSIYPKTPDEESKSKNESIDTLLKIKELGANSQDLEDALNHLDLFNAQFSLNQNTPQPLIEEEN